MGILGKFQCFQTPICTSQCSFTNKNSPSTHPKMSAKAGVVALGRQKQISTSPVYRVPRQPELHRKTLSQKEKEKSPSPFTVVV